MIKPVIIQELNENGDVIGTTFNITVHNTVVEEFDTLEELLEAFHNYLNDIPRITFTA